MKIAMMFLGVVSVAALVGCAGQPVVIASTPRSVQIQGTFFTDADRQNAFNAGQAECQKQGRHARLMETAGVPIKTIWSFDCVS